MVVALSQRSANNQGTAESQEWVKFKNDRYSSHAALDP